MELIELLHLSVRSPSEVTPACVSQVEMGDLLEAARSVKAGSQLIGQRLVVYKAVCACRADRTLVQVHGTGRASCDTGNLGSDRRCTIVEVLRTIPRQAPELSLVLPTCFAMLGIRVGAYRLAPCSATQRGIEVILLLLQH